MRFCRRTFRKSPCGGARHILCLRWRTIRLACRQLTVCQRGRLSGPFAAGRIELVLRFALMTKGIGPFTTPTSASCRTGSLPPVWPSLAGDAFPLPCGRQPSLFGSARSPWVLGVPYGALPAAWPTPWGFHYSHAGEPTGVGACFTPGSRCPPPGGQIPGSIHPLLLWQPPISAIALHDVSADDSLSFARPVFASPGYTWWFCSSLGVDASFVLSLTITHVESGDKFGHELGST